MISLPLVQVPALSALSSPPPRAAFAVLRQMRRSPDDDLFLGCLSLDTGELISFLYRPGIPLRFQHVLCGAAQGQGVCLAGSSLRRRCAREARNGAR